MKYKLIHKATGEEHLCDKVVIDGRDYYVSDETPQKNDKILCDERNHITENPKYKIRTCKSIVNGWIMTFEIDGQGENPNWTKKIIATNNPNIDIPKVVDEVERLAKEYAKGEEVVPFHTRKGFIAGYNKSQETYSFSEEDMIEFGEWLQIMNLGKENPTKPTKEIIQLWKEQKPKTMYYE